MYDSRIHSLNYIARDYLFVSKQGLIYFDEIAKLEPGVYKLFSPLGIYEDKSVSFFLSNQLTNLLTIQLASGRQIEVTGNQAFYSQGMRVYARDLRLGCYIDHKFGVYQSKNDISLLEIRKTYKRNPLEDKNNGCIPSKMSLELGYVAGALVNQKTKIFSLEALEDFCSLPRKNSPVVYLQQLIDKVFPCLEQSRQLRLNQDCVYISKQALQCLANNNLLVNNTEAWWDRVPTMVRYSSYQTIIAFLSGLIDFAGVLDRGLLTLVSSNYKFLQNIQQTAESVGVFFYFSTSDKLHLDLRNSLSSSVKLLRNLSCIDFDKLEFPYLGPLQKMYQVVSISHNLTKSYSHNLVIEGNPRIEDNWFYQGAIKTSGSICYFDLCTETII